MTLCVDNRSFRGPTTFASKSSLWAFEGHREVYVVCYLECSSLSPDNGINPTGLSLGKLQVAIQDNDRSSRGLFLVKSATISLASAHKLLCAYSWNIAPYYFIAHGVALLVSITVPLDSIVMMFPKVAREPIRSHLISLTKKGGDDDIRGPLWRKSREIKSIHWLSDICTYGVRLQKEEDDPLDDQIRPTSTYSAIMRNLPEV